MADPLCECGCGEPVAIAPRSRLTLGIIKGQPLRWADRRHALRGRPLAAATIEKLSAARKGLLVGERNPRWRGGQFRSRDYIYLQVKPSDPFFDMANVHGYVAAHRLVVAQSLGRSLRPAEVVHHLLACEGGSGDPTDNRIENLRLFADQRAHAAHHAGLRKENSHR